MNLMKTFMSIIIYFIKYIENVNKYEERKKNPKNSYFRNKFWY